MKYLCAWLSFFFGVISILDGKDRNFPISDSDAVILTSIKEKAQTSYELSLSREGASAKAFWKYSVPSKASPPSEWCKPIDCNEQAGVIATLLEMNEYTLMLVLYKRGQKTGSESRIFAPKLLKMQRATAGKLRLIAPNLISLYPPSGESLHITVNNGKLVNADGKLFERLPILRRSSPSSPEQEADLKAQQSPPALEPTLDNPFPWWILIIGGVVVAGLVFLLRRK